MRIGELSRRSGVSIRMLRFYEAEGLLRPGRTASGYRDYGRDEEEAVFRITLLRAAGMTLPVIRDFLPCALDARGAFEPCDELRMTVRRQIGRVDDRIESLKRSRAALEVILAQLTLPETRAPAS
ncbi:MerR family transcriptional regulator [Methylobacterium sp. J-048]|uniref:MerR family transcriptional regulator n=1 Tax=Methylobacterium sp. J-048 TaxID=2836635 RepID=UPI001FBB8DFA|nr:MerR family transcriptional regulator [Methylobacterium sp. J-048]MCJ2061105.1 MerR family transcriptional regulator [Methylobacterium sp. J-048]